MSDKQIKISVGLISYNQEAYIAEAINSIFLQTWPVDRLVICDDASSDQTWGVIESTIKHWKERDHCIKEIVLHKNSKNLGYLKNFQQTVALAGGDLFVYQAGDDVSMPGRIEKLVRAYKEAGSPSMALLHSSVYVDRLDESAIWRSPTKFLSTLKDFMLSMTLHIGASEAFDPQLLLKIGHIDEDTYDDLILGARAAMLGTLIAVDEPLLMYRSGGLTSGHRVLDSDSSWRRNTATYRQRLKDAQTLGKRAAENIIQEYLWQLGCIIQTDEQREDQLDSIEQAFNEQKKARVASVASDSLVEFSVSRRVPRLLIVTDVARETAGPVSRLDRFRVLERSGFDVDIVWFNDNVSVDIIAFDLCWIFGCPVGVKVQGLYDSLEVFKSRTIIWEIDCWPDGRRACEDASRALVYANAHRLLSLSSVIVASDVYFAKWLRCRSTSNVVTLSDVFLESWCPILPSGVNAERQSEKREGLKTKKLQIGLRSDNWSVALWGFVEKVLWALSEASPLVSVIIWGSVPDTVRGIPIVQVRDVSGLPSRWPNDVVAEGVDLALLPVLASEMLYQPINRYWLEWSLVGVPVIASNVPRISETLDSSLFVQVTNTIESWINAILRCLNDFEYRLTLSERVRAHVHKHFSMSDQCAKQLELINSVLGSNIQIPMPSGRILTEPSPFSEIDRVIAAADYQRWCRNRELREVDGERLAERVVSWGCEPRILYITVASTPKDFTLLSVTAASLGAQFYPEWRWLVLSDKSAVDPLFESSEQLNWWTLETLDSDDAVSSAVFRAVNKWACDWVCLLVPGTYVHPHAAIEVIDHGRDRHNVQVIFHDHDHWDEAERLGEGILDFDWLSKRRREPWFKPGLDPLWLMQADYVGSAVWWRADELRVRGIEPLPGAWWYASLLAACGEPSAVHHIPEVLMTIPLQCSRDLQSMGRPVRLIAARQAIKEWFSPLTIDLRASVCPRTLHLQVATQRLRISVVLVMQDVHFQCREAIEALWRQQAGEDDIEFVVVVNRLSDPDTFELLAEWRSKCPMLQVIEDDLGYDLIRLYEIGAARAKNDVVIFLHADVVPVDRHMIWRLARDVLLTNGGMVGPLLLRPETMLVDSAGLAPGGAGTWQVCQVLGAPYSFLDDGLWDVLRVLRQVPAVDPVVFAIHRDVWCSLKDLVREVQVPHHFSAMAALRIKALGGRVLLSPYARAAHRRGSSDAFLQSSGEVRRRFNSVAEEDAVRFWQNQGRVWVSDPAWSNALSLRHSGWRLDEVAPLRWPLEGAVRPRLLGYSVSGGSGEYRVKSPFRALAQAGMAYTEIVDERSQALLTPAELLRLQPDTILLHQWLGQATATAIDGWRKVHPDIRIILGLDDRNDAVPEKSNLYLAHRRAHPDARAKLRRMAERCDGVIVSTPPLKAMLDELGVRDRDVYVIPNALGRNRWGAIRPPRRARSKPRVGWIGALQHRGDLEFLIPVIRATHDKVDWIFMGMVLPEIQRYVREFHRWVSYDRYPMAIADLDLDLAVAPLAYNIFNECKSNLRLLEYGASGYPVICTDITPYRENTPPVTRLDNQADLWIDAIRTAVSDVDALRAEGEALRRWVWTHYDLDSHLESWHQALTGDSHSGVRP